MKNDGVLQKQLKKQTKYVIIWLLITIGPFLLFITIIQLFVNQISGITLLFGAKIDSATSLTYYEGESFYGLPYNNSFSDGNYTSIISQMSSGQNTISKNYINKVSEINTKIKDVLTDVKVGDVVNNTFCIMNNTIGTGTTNFCQNRLIDLYDIRIGYVEGGNDREGYYLNEIINVTSGNNGTKYLFLELTDKLRSNTKTTLYVYDNIAGEIDKTLFGTITGTYKSSLKQSIIPKTSEYDGLRYYDLFIKNKSNLRFYSDYDNEREPNPNEEKLMSSNNILGQIDNYFLSKDHFIDRIFHLPEEYNFKAAWTDTFQRKLSVEIASKILNPKSNNYEGIGKDITELFKQIHLNESSRYYNSAMVDMLNFSGIQSPENTKSSLSNQYILSNEKINLTYFNNLPFGKDYKNMIIETDKFKTLTIKDVKEILNYKDDISEDDSEFGYIIGSELINKLTNFNGGTTLLKVNKTNNEPLVREGSNYYSPNITYNLITGGLSERSNCSILYPRKGAGDFVSYSKETIYTGQEVKVRCTYPESDPSFHTFYAPHLIQEAEITFYKRFIFDDENNKKSYRKRDEYFLNYFYDKEYILDSSTVINQISLINDVYLDRESIIFRGVYMKVKGFGIEIQDEGRLITTKKTHNGFSNILPDAPITIEIGILTELNKEIPEIQKFHSEIYSKRLLMDNISNQSIYNNPLALRYYDLNRFNRFDYTENPFFTRMEMANYKTNHLELSDKYINLANAIENGLQNNEISPDILDLLRVYYEKEAINQKNSYFFTASQNEKLINILDDLYNISNDTPQSEILKKYIVLLGNFTTDGAFGNVLDKYNGTLNTRSFFNKNYYYPITSNTSISQSRNLINSLNSCHPYNFLNKLYKNTTNGKSMYITGYNLEGFDKLLEIEKELVEPCYNQYIPYVEVTIFPIREKFNTEAQYQMGLNTVINNFGELNFNTYINNPDLTFFILSDFYYVEGIEETKHMHMINMFYDDKKTLGENQQYINNNINSFYHDVLNNQNLFLKYRNTEEYSRNCYSNGTLLPNAENRNFKCRLSEIYDEFLGKLANNEKAYYFIKEEILKESIQIQPFSSYYNTSQLDECDRTFCSQSINGFIQPSLFVPLPYELFHDKLIVSQIPLTARDRNTTGNFGGFNISINDYTAYHYFLQNDKINDFTYFFDMNKAFSFNTDNYHSDIDLHMISLNPNLYLHSFIQHVKNGEKYHINVYGNGFDSVIHSKNKKEFEKSLLSKINNFIFNYVNNRKIINDLSESFDGSDGFKNFDVGFVMRELGTFWGQTTSDKNINNYIDNVKIGNTLQGVNATQINRNSLSNYDLIVNPQYYSRIIGKVSQGNNKQIQNRKAIMDRYFYSIYLINLIDVHLKINYANFSTTILSGTIDDILTNANNIDNDIVLDLYKDTLLHTLGYVPEDILGQPFGQSGFFNSIITLGSSVWRETIEDIISEDYKNIYKKTRTYSKASNNIKNSVEFKNAIKNLENQNFMSDFVNFYGKITNDQNNELFYLNSIDIKKEKVLNMELFYGDLLGMIVEDKKVIEQNLEIFTQDIDYIGDNIIIVDDFEITTIISNQLEIIKILKNIYPNKYAKFYLEPILSIEGKITNSEDVDELIELFKFLKEEYNVKGGNLSEYNYYMYIVGKGLFNDYVKTINSNNFHLPIQKINNYYGFGVSKDTSINSIRNQFLLGNRTTYFPIYNILGDLFNNKENLNSTQRIIELTSLEYLRIRNLILLKEIFYLNLDKEEIINNNPNDEIRINAIDQQIKLLENQIETNKERKEIVEKSIKEFDIVLPKFRYIISIRNNMIEIEEEAEILNDFQIKNNQYKSIFFRGPFSDSEFSGFKAYNYGKKKDTIQFGNLINTYLAMSFMLHNMRMTEDGVKNIVDELSSYTIDNHNKEIGRLQDFDNIGPFANYYINNSYTPYSGNNTIRFELKLKIEGESDTMIGGGGVGGIFQLQNNLRMQSYSANFEKLKTEYCGKISIDSQKQTCINYMDYLKTLNPASLQLELDYLKLLTYIEKLPASGDRWNRYGAATYGTLANRFDKNTTDYEYLVKMGQTNSGALGQCTWYTSLLKANFTRAGNGNAFYNTGRNRGYDTSYINPRSETVEQMMSKVQIGDIISFQGRNSVSGQCITTGAAGLYGHVGVIIGKDSGKGTITVAEANVRDTLLIDSNEYYISKICPAGLVHGVEWRY